MRTNKQVTVEPFYGPLPFRQRTYRGVQAATGGPLVTVEADGIMRQLRTTAPTGFAWAIPTDGAEQLARVILLDYLGFEPSTVLRQAFTIYVIARLPLTEFVLLPREIRNGLRRIGEECGITCLRCLDVRRIDGEFDCPVCRPDDGSRTRLRVEGLRS